MSGTSRWLATPVLVVLYAVALVLLGIWLGTTGSYELKLQLAPLTPWSLELSFLLLLGGGWAARREVGRTLSGNRLTPVLLALAGFIAVTFLPPRTHRIFYDEDIYQNVGQNILWRNQAEMCNEGVIEHGTFECFAAEYNKEPSAFPFLLSFLFRLTGVKETSAHLLNNLLFSFGVFCAYWLGSLVFRNRRAAFAAGVLYLLTPENLLWGATVAVEPGAAAFAGLAVGAWILFLKEESLATALFAAGAVAYAAQWRPESLLIIPLAALATLVFAPNRLRRRELYGVAFLVLMLLLPHIGHIWAVRGESWGSGEAGKFAWLYVSGNLESNSIFYLEGKEHPLFFTLLALLGIAFGGRWKEKLVPLAWFLLFFGIFIPFHAGSYRYGADVRFSLLCAMPLALLGGAGAAWLSGWMEQRAGGSRWASAAPLVAMAYFFTGFLPLVGSVGREAWAARADHNIASELLKLVPEGSMVLTHNPGMIQVMGRSAVQASVATYQPAKVDEFFRRFPGGVYFHFNFWCNVPDPVQNAFCTKILETYPTEVVEERSAGTYRYVLHRIMPKREALP